MRGRLFLGMAVLTATILTGCGGGSRSKPNVAAGELAVSPPILNFGKVAVGTRKGLTGTLTAGDAQVTVSSADWSGEGYTVGGIVFPVTVPAGQSVPFKVTFAPRRGGRSPGEISFKTDAQNATRAAFSGNGAQTGTHRVTLAWQSAAASVAGYNVYRGAASQGPYTKITGSPHPNSTFTDASVIGGQTYFYMTTSVSKNGKESKYSNQIQVRIPNS